MGRTAPELKVNVLISDNASTHEMDRWRRATEILLRAAERKHKSTLSANHEMLLG